MNPASRGRGAAGMTLIELVTALTVMTVLVGIVGPMLISALTATNRLERTSASVDDARRVVAQLDRELRSAQCISQPAENSAGNTLVFDTLADGVQATVTYRVVGTNLTRQRDVGAEHVVVSPVGTTSTAFRQLVTPLRTVEVNIPIRSANGGEFVLQTTIAGRNAWRTC